MPINLKLEKEKERRRRGKGEEEKLYNKKKGKECNLLRHRGKKRVQGQNRGNEQKEDERKRKK